MRLGSNDGKFSWSHYCVCLRPLEIRTALYGPTVEGLSRQWRVLGYSDICYVLWRLKFPESISCSLSIQEILNYFSLSSDTTASYLEDTTTEATGEFLFPLTNYGRNGQGAMQRGGLRMALNAGSRDVLSSVNFLL